ncbi:uncharacterized protein LOC114757601 isoform X2 [Neltuma alba]|uniref:uncharacterized protein LOC114757601 isoform X2 n=1 Tax=Neltuma alba TaxID=207710 RepID=UPI0010A5205F|nr:uncharacterized protein LOC114757601 isoform X2 [Prosopis alba]
MEIGTSSTAAPLTSSPSQVIDTCAPQMTDQYSVDIHPAMNIPNQTCAAQYSDDMSIEDFMVSESAQQTIEPHLMEDLSTAAPLMSSAPQTGCAPQMIAQDSDIHPPVTKDIEELIQDCGDGRLSQHRCIYRVPSKLRDLKQNAYTPKVVSFGPFHCRNEGLQDMQRHKHILLKRFMQRTKSSCCKLVEFVQKLEP